MFNTLMKKLNKMYNWFHKDTLDRINIFYFLNPEKLSDELVQIWLD